MYSHTKRGKMATLVLGLRPRQFVDLEILSIYIFMSLWQLSVSPYLLCWIKQEV